MGFGAALWQAAARQLGFPATVLSGSKSLRRAWWARGRRVTAAGPGGGHRPRRSARPLPAATFTARPSHQRDSNPRTLRTFPDPRGGRAWAFKPRAGRPRGAQWERGLLAGGGAGPRRGREQPWRGRGGRRRQQRGRACRRGAGRAAAAAAPRSACSRGRAAGWRAGARWRRRRRKRRRRGEAGASRRPRRRCCCRPTRG